MRPRALAGLLPAAAIACASGCGGTDCGDVGPPAPYSFTALLELPQGDIPADIEITLGGAGTNTSLRLEDLGADAASPCTVDNGISCAWGDGSPGAGTLDATAAGFAPVHLDLEATPAACNGVVLDHERATLTPQ
ncbi:hypothetical protein [Sorangium cellulosum]|uniref:hypothetical protein n=1 Tax=Sorangium cellulosum TaxID=56 RepID=UPI000CF4AD11|nr:hypothetical protein [Sorangium cellulosum]